MKAGEKGGHAEEMRAGKRFGFGKNWKSFLATLDDERICEAENSLTQMLGTGDFSGLGFLDVGSGSGLFSLAARRRGARVHSFDYDPESVECTRELKRRYFPDDRNWTVEEGSVLDREYLRALGTFDIVYSWGVLHHTGAMWDALDNVSAMVSKGGRLFIALYNDQGWKSKFWLAVKKTSCSSRLGKASMHMIFIPAFAFIGLGADLLRGENPLLRYTRYKQERGMSRLHDWYDWLGGYPFEVASEEAVINFFRERNFTLTRLVSAEGGLRNNEFVFLYS